MLDRQIGAGPGIVQLRPRSADVDDGIDRRVVKAVEVQLPGALHGQGV